MECVRRTDRLSDYADAVGGCVSSDSDLFIWRQSRGGGVRIDCVAVKDLREVEASA
jgi:hypothetical protein